ncbi:hypothetical protein [Mycobacterium pseudokansasii]|uniref:Uncharacterized protein n=1 Tax=Mycobacterium pseudokansasii TaxID=2341080 RepID=A0A498QUZ5_9MYCO|nr:hypothetical protein [Mycobacterium pseudokansasii]EUA01002.1 hypothetical protein I546_6460 [Mycobacterium kansasii 732]KZS69871.1 hypothetical protein A4G27_10265 [Mycobacterium kansasii]MBY0389629.1 hypothetical protein [Mycobacterium pseudokansasii]VBA31784.1 hypothetical protein LAUMK35_05099 [Mycobacterium pseudokansasii]VBA33559.1 hypothetical protein LAUMK21_05058 [Mycobacterium pseudokansasii]
MAAILPIPQASSEVDWLADDGLFESCEVSTCDAGQDYSGGNADTGLAFGYLGSESVCNGSCGGQRAGFW